MSQLERLAEAVGQVGKQSGPVMQSVSRTEQAANRVAAAVPNDEAGYSRTIRTQLYEGVAALRDVERLLTDFDKQADAFAKRLVGGSGTATGVAGSSGRATEAGAASIEEVRSWLGQINPGYSDSEFNPRAVNCGNCALAVFDAFAGKPVRDAGFGTLTIPEMEKATGKRQVAMTPSQIADHLRAGGAGSHAVVGVDRSGGSGHWFNAYYDGHDVWAIDGQTGVIRAWPPEYGSTVNPVVYWDVSI